MARKPRKPKVKDSEQVSNRYSYNVKFLVKASKEICIPVQTEGLDIDVAKQQAMTSLESVINQLNQTGANFELVSCLEVVGKRVDNA